MAKDPYKYFRIEARELLEGLSQGIIELERSGNSKELIGRLLRLAHTFKGAARVVKQKEVSELAHRIEDLLEPFRDGVSALPAQNINQILQVVDACGESLKPVLSVPEEERSQTAPREMERSFFSVRVEITELDAILADLAGAGRHLGAMDDEVNLMERAAKTTSALVHELGLLSTGDGNGRAVDFTSPLREKAEQLRIALTETYRSVRSRIERVRRDVGSIRDRVRDVRLLPASSIFATMERTARDAAEVLKKRVRFEALGGEHRLDSHILLALGDALAHVIRNAVAHGIEVESVRSGLGKPTEGHVRLEVHKAGQRIHFVVKDDGAGVNVVAIRDSLIAKRLITPAEARSLELHEAIQRLLEGGLSTASEVTEVMGRGVGLDVVRSTVARLKGEIDLRSEPGRGTTVEIMVPVSMESVDVLAVVSGDVRALIPFDAIRRTVRLIDKDLAQSSTGAIFVSEGRALPFRSLAEIINGKRQSGFASRKWTTLVVQAKGTHVAVGVDRLVGVRNVVVRPLPALCGPIPMVAGATLDAEGNPELVLDPIALVAAVRSQTLSVIEPDLAQSVWVLVVDDSLTSRMLEQSILETAGYQVDMATCGEEALEMAREKEYAVFVIDVEMPGMNGFELLERFRIDPLLQKTPAILVTSRASPEDRKRGQQAGALAHIAKSEFEEGRLLRTIQGLIQKELS